MKPRLLANENWPRPALVALRQSGIDVDYVAERMPRATDAEILRRAVSEQRWLLTFDRDYGDLVYARRVPPPPAIVYLRQGRYSPDWPARAVLDLLRNPEWVSGHMVVVAGRGVRRRPLPVEE